MNRFITAATAVVLASNPCYAGSGDTPIALLHAESDLIVLGTIVSKAGGFNFEGGVVDYTCKCEVAAICKGDAEFKGKTISVFIQRSEREERDKHPLLKDGSECMLFLKKTHGRELTEWVLADSWFGIQNPSPSMARELQRMSREE